MKQGTYLRLGNLQVPHLNTARREIGDLKLDVDGSLRLADGPGTAHTTSKSTRHAAAGLVVALDGGETQLRAHQELLAAAELLDLPDDGGLLGGVVHCSDVGAEAGRVGVFGDGDEDLDVVGGAAAFELCFCLSRGYVLANVQRDSKRKQRLCVPSACTQSGTPSAIPPNIRPKSTASLVCSIGNS